MTPKHKLAESNVPVIGGVIAAIGASLCCVGPFVLLTLGISGAWIGNLTLLEPYRPFFIVIVLLLFGWSGWQVHRPIEACASGTACAVPQTRKRRQIIVWTTAIIALILVSSSYWIPLIA
ncbi:mercuric transporter MerT [Alcanivorax nanhaiticus]|uniref:Mercuric transport protein MerT n=1 Tax=Alcanivorax nanhaiticus TaxID=1177154 RepID=A0A095UU93_9GAMM|nr:mercuric transporter MerT family protein [Alcanivorax nanhaiticus]KGD66070.1 mercuric transporter MerT [Alcanivorax nanhaiticus]